MRDWITILVIILVVALVYYADAVPRDDSDPNGSRSGLTIYTDNLTGCQYVKGGLFGGITPRLDENGKPICRK